MPKIKLRTAYLITCLFFLIALLVLIPQFTTLANSIETVKNANPAYIFLGLLTVFLTYIAATFTLRVIALRQLNLGRTLLIQLASGFATKLVPAGIGGVALNTKYLIKSKHTLPQATSVLALNSSLGFIGHITILIVCFMWTRENINTNIPVPAQTIYLVLGMVFFVSLVLVLWSKLRLKLVNFIASLLIILKSYLKQPKKLIMGFIWASAVTILFACCLYFCALAVGISLTPLAVLWTLTIGLIGANLTPTPGGIGGAEAAMTGALIATGLDINQALPVALTYRLLTYWVPIIPGFILFRTALARKYI